MYSNNKGFSIVDILVKIVFFILFIFVLIYLFPQVSDLNPFYNNVFRENLSYMEDAAENYFNIVENQPTKVGDTKKITLKEMISNNLLIPFVDKNNNSCNIYESYAVITKEKDGFKLKINLKCNDEENYIEKYLGCNNYCDGVNCKNCTSCQEKPATPIETVPEAEKCYNDIKTTYYQYKKSNEILNVTYYCEQGELDQTAKTCYRVIGTDVVVATPEYTPVRVVQEPATKIPGESYKKYVAAIVSTTPDVIRTEQYPCTETETERQCEDVSRQEPYNCNCKVVEINGRAQTVCDICTRTVTEQVCKDVTVEKPAICIREITVPGTTTYDCPIGTTKEGTDKNLKCYTIKYNPDTYKCENPNAKLVGSVCNITIPGVIKGYKCPTDYTFNEVAKTCSKVLSETTEAQTKIERILDWQYQWSKELAIPGWVRTGNVQVDVTTVEVPCK